MFDCDLPALQPHLGLLSNVKLIGNIRNLRRATTLAGRGLVRAAFVDKDLERDVSTIRMTELDIQSSL